MMRLSRPCVVAWALCGWTCGGSTFPQAAIPAAARWQQPVRLGTGPQCFADQGDVDHPRPLARWSAARVAADAREGAVVAWARCDAPGSESAFGTADLKTDIWSARFAQDGWNAAQRIGGDTTDGQPRVGGGDGVAIWVTRPEPQRIGASSSAFDPAHGWRPPAPFGGGDVAGLEIRGRRQPVAIWTEARLGAYGVLWASAALASGWSRPAALDAGALSFWTEADDSGNLVVVWTRIVESDACFACEELWASRFVDGSRWETPRRLAAAAASEDHSQARLAVSAPGDAIVVWPTLSRGLMAARFRPQSGWGAPFVALRSSPERPRDEFSYRATLSAGGDALVVWRGEETAFQLAATHIRNDDSVENVHVVADGVWTFVLVGDADGNAVVAWSVWPIPATELRAARFRAAESWGSVETVRRNDASSRLESFAAPSDIALDGAGRAHVTWNEQRDDQIETWTARLAP